MGRKKTSVAQQKLRKMTEPPRVSQAALARELDVSPQAVQHWVQGTAKPSLEKMLELEKAHGIPVAEWAKSEEDEEEEPRRKRARKAA